MQPRGGGVSGQGTDRDRAKVGAAGAEYQHILASMAQGGGVLGQKIQIVAPVGQGQMW